MSQQQGSAARRWEARRDEAPSSTILRPALLVRRAGDAPSNLNGRRARFLLSSRNGDGEWLAHGWRDGLRLACDSPVTLDDLDEPALWVQYEHDYYADATMADPPKLGVGLSRVWVEEYVLIDSRQSASSPTWIDNLNQDPNAPQLRLLDAVEGHPDPIGHRVVLHGATITCDVRAVSPVRISDGGEPVIAVMSESDWYGWSQTLYGDHPHPSLRWISTRGMYVE